MTRSAIGNFRWAICALLFFATTVNYLDRQVLSLLAPSLSREFGWSNTDYANVAAAFQLVYALAQLFVGRIVDRLGTKRAYLLAILVWSAGAVMHAWSIAVGQAINGMLALLGMATLPVSIAGFIAARVVLGLGEAGNFPAALKATAEYFPMAERSLATGIFNSGANVGAILAPLSVPLIAALWGWQAAFVAIGAVGFLWMGFWNHLYEEPERQTRITPAELAWIRADDRVHAPAGVPACADVAAAGAPARASWFALLALRQTWAFALGKFITDGVWWFFLFWLPKYLTNGYGVTGPALALPLTVLYTMTMVGSIGGGWWPALFMRRGASPFEARMKAMLRIAVLPLVVLLAQPLGALGVWYPVILIGIGASSHQAWSCNLLTTVSDMFPRRSVASVAGIGGLAGGLGGVLVTKLGGRLFDHYEAAGHPATGYLIMFTYCALAYLAAWCVMRLLLPARALPALPAGVANA
jgi:ACS family hexuronate transporter-like MFS transporter